MSKLDEAFLKAYAKDRGAATRSEPAVTAEEATEDIGSEIWTDSDGQRVVRRDDGVLNVASFIARSAAGRPRGTVPPQGDAGQLRENGVSVSLQEVASEAAEPPLTTGTDRISFDGAHSLGGPHFQPIALDLGAFDLFTQTDLLQSTPIDLHSGTRLGKAPAPLTTSQETVQSDVRQASKPIDITSTPSDAKVLRLDAMEPAAPVPSIAPTDPVEPLVAQPVPRARTSFQAVWEVDRFEFEEIVEELCEESSPLWEAARQLRAACDEGLRVLAVTSPLREQGRSTLAITLARMVATSGLNAVLLDGDMDRPAIAEKLSLEIRLGWGDAIRTDLPAEEVAVHSVADRFTVMPLAAPGADKEGRPSAAATTAMLEGLTAAFDLVIIDTSNINVIGGWIPGADSPCQIDAALIIDDTRNHDPNAQQACIRRLQKLGIENVGIVENFTD